MSFQLSPHFHATASVLLALPIGLLTLSGCRDDDNTPPKPDDNTPVVVPADGNTKPAYTVAEIPDVTNESYADLVQDFDGPVVLNYSTDWCPPCHAMKPVLVDVQNDWVEGRIYTIDGDDVVAATYKGHPLQEIYNKHLPVEIPNRSDKVVGFPTYVLLDANKEVIGVRFGATDKEDFKAWIEDTLKNPGQEVKQNLQGSAVPRQNDSLFAAMPKLGLG